MSNILRSKEFTTVLVFILSTLYVLHYFIQGVEPFDNLMLTIGNWAIISSAAAAGLGLANLSIIHVNKIRKKESGWYWDIWMVSVMFFTFLLGSITSSQSSAYQWIYVNVYQPLGTSIFSLAYLWMCSVAVVAFRVKNRDAAFLMLGGLLSLIGNIPMVQVYTNVFFDAKTWALNIPVRGVGSALRISLALGLVLVGIRTWLGIDTSYVALESEGG